MKSPTLISSKLAPLTSPGSLSETSQRPPTMSLSPRDEWKQSSLMRRLASPISHSISRDIEPDEPKDTYCKSRKQSICCDRWIVGKVWCVVRSWFLTTRILRTDEPSEVTNNAITPRGDRIRKPDDSNDALQLGRARRSSPTRDSISLSATPSSTRSTEGTPSAVSAENQEHAGHLRSQDFICDPECPRRSHHEGTLWFLRRLLSVDWLETAMTREEQLSRAEDHAMEVFQRHGRFLRLVDGEWQALSRREAIMFVDGIISKMMRFQVDRLARVLNNDTRST